MKTTAPQDAAPDSGPTTSFEHDDALSSLDSEPSSSADNTVAVEAVRASKRSRKRRRISHTSPSVHLVNALRLTNNHHALPPTWDKPGLVHGHAGNVNERARRMSSEKRPSISMERGEISLQSILAKHIMTADNEDFDDFASLPMDDLAFSSSPAQLTFSNEDRQYLECRGYTETDLPRWARLLLSKEVLVAWHTFFGSHEKAKYTPQERLPLFLFLFLLRREHIDAATLKMFLKYAWEILESSAVSIGSDKGSRTATTENQDFLEDRAHGLIVGAREQEGRELDDYTIFIMFVRLLRHARKVCPGAIVNITSIMTTYLGNYVSPNDLVSEQPWARTSRLTLLYNRALSLLAFPTSIRPFACSIFQEQAQFNLLRAMTKHKPPLDVTQEGYRAVARLQLARGKTDRERDWTSLQAKSWPPWKQDRTRLDEDKDMEYGLSRAGHSIRRMMEAGYGDGAWEDVGRLFTGWDTDQSPTVQTRYFLKPHEPIPERLWAARITATRTVREAWACFESFKNSGESPGQLVYVEMIRKLLLASRAAREEVQAEDMKAADEIGNDKDIDNDMTLQGEDVNDEGYTTWMPPTVLPGDTLQPFADPISPSELTYTRTEPPSANSLFQQMLDDGIEPSGRTRSILARWANSVVQAVKFLEAGSPNSKREVEILLSSKEEDMASLQSVPDDRFAAFISVLCHFPTCPEHFGESRHHEYRRWFRLLLPRWRLRWDSLVLHAYCLVMIRKPTHRKPWYNVLRALSHPGVRVVYVSPVVAAGENSFAALKLIRQMHGMLQSTGLGLDSEGFKHICGGVENAAVSCLVMQSRMSEEHWRMCDKESGKLAKIANALESPQKPWSKRTFSEADQVWAQSPQFLRLLFQSTVSGNRRNDRDKDISVLPRPDIPPIPRLLSVPNPAELHAFVRALGILGDHEGIWSVVQWMVEHKEELWMQVQEELGGKTRWRRLLSAIRVFLEYSHLERRVREFRISSEMNPAPPELRLLVRAKIEEVSDWGGWPTANEVRKYVWTNSERHPHQKSAVKYKAIPTNRT